MVDSQHPIAIEDLERACNPEWRIRHAKALALPYTMVHIQVFIIFHFKLSLFLFAFWCFCALYDLNIVILLDNDYYYGGSMRDLNNGYNRPRKASSVSHLGELFIDYERYLNSCQLVFGALERCRIHCVVNWMISYHPPN